MCWRARAARGSFVEIFKKMQNSSASMITSAMCLALKNESLAKRKQFYQCKSKVCDILSQKSDYIRLYKKFREVAVTFSFLVREFYQTSDTLELDHHYIGDHRFILGPFFTRESVCIFFCRER